VLLGAALMAGASLLRIPTRSAIRVTPATSVIAALPLIRIGREEFLFVTELGIVLAGVALTWLVIGRDHQPRISASYAARLLLAGLTYVTLFELIGTGLLRPLTPAGSGWLGDWWLAVTIAIVSPVAYVAEGVIASIMRSPVSRSLRTWGEIELRDFDTYLVMVVTGALFGLTYWVIGWFAVAVAGVPFLLALGSFRRLAETRTTNAQTVRALAQIPEAAGHVDPGHAVRVADISAGVARIRNVKPALVETVSWAAHLHDIGRISLNDPGVVKLGYTDADIAEWSAVVAREAGLHDVADILRMQHEPYRRPGQQPDPDIPEAARIIKVSSAYDDLIQQGHSMLEALEQLHLGSIYDYDPDIVIALRRLLETKGALSPG
jgi:hypothetical protein